MGILRKIERAIESRLEGGAPAGDLHVLEAARNVCRQLLDHKFRWRKRTFLPNMLLVPFKDPHKAPPHYAAELVRLVQESLSGSIFELLAPFQAKLVPREAGFETVEVGWMDERQQIALGLIECLEGPAQGKRWLIPRQGAILGRGGEVPLAIVGDLLMSRHHLKIAVVAGGRILLEDLGSSNGPQVGGKVLPPRHQVVVNSGTRLEAGCSSFVAAAFPAQYERWQEGVLPS